MTGNPQSLAASIVIVTHNRCADLCEALDALPLEHLEEHDAEIVVVDDASTDDTVATVERRYPHVRLLRNDTNRGPSYSRNAGSCAALGRLLLYTDSDAVPNETWLPTMIAHDDGETILIGAVRDYEGDRIQSGPRRATFIGKSVRCHPSKANTGASCNLGVPRKCFEAIGGFDEDLPYYFEDSDFCIRARRAGFRAAYIADAEVRHKGNEFKRGRAAWMQEHNSTYAMLKAYRGQPAQLVAFTVLNSGWAAARAMAYTLRGQGEDAKNIAKGNISANRRYFFGKTPEHVA